MIVSEASTTNVLLTLALALASVVNYNRKWCSSSFDFIGAIYNHNMFIVKATSGLYYQRFTIINSQS